MTERKSILTRRGFLQSMGLITGAALVAPAMLLGGKPEPASVTSGYLRVHFGAASQSILTPGKTYRMKGYARSTGNAAPQVHVGNTALWVGTTSAAWQTFDTVFVAEHIDLKLIGGPATEPGFVKYDDLALYDESLLAADTYSVKDPDCGLTVEQMMEAQNIPHDEGIVDSDMEDPGTAPWGRLTGRY